MFQTILKISIDAKESLMLFAFLGSLGAILVNFKTIYNFLFNISLRRKLLILKESLNDRKVEVLSEKEVIKSTNIAEESQLDLINNLFVLKPATDINLDNLDTTVQDMREERINKFMSW